MTRDDTGWPRCADRPELAAVTAAIDGGRCSVLVVEVLGLLAHAHVARPSDVFTVLGHRLRETGAVPDWVTPPVVRRLRMDAEHHAHARARSTSTPVDLAAIWQELAAAPIRGDAVAAADRELTVLADLLGPDPQVAAVIEAAAARVPVVLLGPPDWTAAQLGRVLVAAQIPMPASATTLGRGGHGPERLAQTLAGLSGCEGGTGVFLLAAADTDTARLPAEISVLRAPALDERLAALNLREGVPDDPYGADDPLIHPVHGDFGLTALRRTALMSRGPVSGDDADRAVAEDYGLTVLGPVLTGFAEWVVRRAAARGVHTVFCPMREGELLAELIDRAARARSLPVTARPMWLSRQVASAAAAGELTEETVVDCARQRFGLTGRTLAIALGLSGDDPAVPTGLRDRVLDDAQLHEFAAAVAADAGARARAAEAAARVRDGLWAHLTEIGAFDEPEMILVDLGWGGTIQQALAAALRESGRGGAPSGLYLATGPRSADVVRGGGRIEGFLGESGEPAATIGPILRSPEVLEQAVTALCGSLVDMEVDGTPVLGPTTGDAAQDGQRRAVQDGIRAFQRHWARQVRMCGERQPDLAAAPQRLGAVLAGAVLAPTPAEARVFGAWRHDDNFGSAVVTTLVPPETAALRAHLSPSDVRDAPVREVFWPGALVAADPLLAAATAALAAGRLPAAALDGAPGRGGLRTRVAIGTDGPVDGPELSIRTNHHGLGVARLALPAGATTVELRASAPPMIVRIDRLTVRDQRSAQARTVRAAVPVGARRLAADTYLLDGSEAALRIRLPAPDGEALEPAVLVIACAVLTPDGPGRLGGRVARLRRLMRVTRDELRFGGVRAAARRARRV